MLKPLNLLLFPLIFFSNQIGATHLNGGDITYTYIGGSTGIPHQYEITLRTYWEPSGYLTGQWTAPQNQIININSSCFSSSQLTLDLDTSLLSLTASRCVKIDRSYNHTYIITYKKTVTLPGTCTDFLFSYSNCCSATITNSTTTSVSIYFESSLNNTVGNFSSPIFYDTPFKSLYDGKKNGTPLFIRKRNYDSLHYEFSTPKTGAASSLSYHNGLSAQVPFKLKSGTNLEIDYENQMAFATPDTSFAVAWVNFKVSIYRFDTLFNQYIKAGEINKVGRWQVYEKPDSLQSSFELFRNANAFHSFQNGMMKLQVQIPSGLTFPTIEPAASDFRLYQPNGAPLAITGLNYLAQNDTTSIIEFSLARPYNQNGTYTLEVRSGNDLNTVANSCYFFTQPDTLNFNVNFVGIAESKNPEIDIFPNPANDILNIDHLQKGQVVEIYSLEGRLLNQTLVAHGTIQLDLNNFPKGLIILSVKNKSGKPIKKQLVIHK